MGNPRDDATADEVLMLYLGQYRVERVFRTSKSEFEVNSIYIQKPSRANAFMFMVSLGTMVPGVINAVMRRKWLLNTARG